MTAATVAAAEMPVRAAALREEDATLVALRRLAEEVEGLNADPETRAGDEEQLRRRVRFFLTRLEMAEGAWSTRRPEVWALRSWLGTSDQGSAVRTVEVARPVGLRPGTHEAHRFALSVLGREPAPGPGRRRGVGLMVGLLLTALVAIPLVALVMGYKAMIVLSGSMAPAIPTGTLILVEPVAAERVRVGDVITFPNPNNPPEYVTHRVIGIDDDLTGRFIRTKGDANSAPDSWRVPATGTLGRYLVAVPQLGFVFRAVADPVGRMAFLVLPSLVLGAMTLVSVWRGDAPAPAQG